MIRLGSKARSAHSRLRYLMQRMCSPPQLHSPKSDPGMNGRNCRRPFELQRASYETSLRSESTAPPVAIRLKIPALISQPLSLDGPKSRKRYSRKTVESLSYPKL